MKKFNLKSYLFITDHLYFHLENILEVKAIDKGFAIKLNHNNSIQTIELFIDEIIDNQLNFTSLVDNLSQEEVDMVLDRNKKNLNKNGHYQFEVIRSIENEYSLLIVKDFSSENNRYYFTILGHDKEYYGIINADQLSLIHILADSFSSSRKLLNHNNNNTTYDNTFSINVPTNAKIKKEGFVTGTPKSWPIDFDGDSAYFNYEGTFFQIESEKETNHSRVLESEVDINNLNNGSIHQINNENIKVIYHLIEYEEGNGAEAQGYIQTPSKDYFFTVGHEDIDLDKASKVIFNIFKDIALV